MKSVKWRTVLRSACNLATVSVLLFGAMTAAATDVVVAPPDKGTLYLETGAYDRLQFRWDQPGESPDIIQKILDKSWVTHRFADICSLILDASTPTPGGLVTVPTNAGFLGDHIGIKSSYSLCSEITGSESFRLALGGLLTGYQVFHTELNLEMKQHAVVKIVTQLGAGTPKTFILRSDGSYPGSELCSFTLPEHDVCRWKSDELWDSVTVTALAGRVSIEAGSGGGGTTFSKFRLTKLDKTLACPPEGSDVGPPITASGDNSAAASLTRLENSDGSACTPIPVALDWTGGKLQFFGSSQTTVTTIRITWPNLSVPPATLASIPLSKQTFGTDTPIDLIQCGGSPVYGVDPITHEIVLTDITGLNPVTDDQSTSLGGFQYGCVYERHITFPPPGGALGLEEFVYLRGDWGALRL